MRILTTNLSLTLLTVGVFLASTYKGYAKMQVQISLPRGWVDVSPTAPRQNLEQVKEPLRSNVMDALGDIDTFPDTTAFAFVLPNQSSILTVLMAPFTNPQLKELDESFVENLIKLQKLNATKETPTSQWNFKEKGFTILAGLKAIRVLAEITTNQKSQATILYYLVSSKSHTLFVTVITPTKVFGKLKDSLEETIKNSIQIVE